MTPDYALLFSNYVGLSSGALRIGVGCLVLAIKPRATSNRLLFFALFFDGLLALASTGVSYYSQIHTPTLDFYSFVLRGMLVLACVSFSCYLGYVMVVSNSWTARIRKTIFRAAILISAGIAGVLLVYREQIIQTENLEFVLSTGQVLQNPITGFSQFIYTFMIGLLFLMVIAAWRGDNLRIIRFGTIAFLLMVGMYNVELFSKYNLMMIFSVFITLGFARITMEKSRYEPARQLNMELLKNQAAIKAALEMIDVKVQERKEELDENIAHGEQLAEQLQTQLQAEHELNDLKASIIRTVSHEFRTPLTVISNSVQLLDRYADRMTPAKQAQQRDRIDIALENLDAMLTDVAMVEAASHPNKIAEYYSVRFNQFASLLEKQVRAKFRDANRIEFFYDQNEQMPLRADLQLTTSILLPIINNALKYSPAQERVEVDITLPNTHTIQLMVRDNGVGILPEERDSVFDMFTRGSNIDERSGLGLGLYLVKNFVNTLEGEMAFESGGRNRGTTFTIKLPTVPSSETHVFTTALMEAV